MSEAFAQFLETGVSPGLDFVPPPPPPPPPPPDPNDLAHTGPLHLDGTTEEVAAHLGELATEAAQQVADVALQALGTLSGALLAGRAALAATKVLAGAAVRAAEEQRCLERQEKVSADAAEQWRNAAFAAARANARRRALGARIARAARTAPGDPPPRPDLPGPLDPAAGRLGDFRRELTRFERALEAAERTQAAWEAEALLATLADPVGGTDGEDGPDWQDMLRARRDDMIRAHLDAQEAPPPVPEPPRATAPADGTAVRDQGADILAALDPRADAELVRMASEAVGHAVAHAARPQRSRRHLREARTFVTNANRKAWKLRREVEQAAVRLDFLTMPLPDDQDLPDPDPQAVAALRKCVDEQVPLTAGERDLVERSTTARCAALEALYLRRQCTGVLARLAMDTAGDLRVGHTDDHAVTLDWTPGGWGPDHWLRMELRGETVHVVTMRPATRGERRPEDLERDARRCAEAAERLDEFRALAAEAGLPLTFEMHRGEVLPGAPVEAATRDPRDKRGERGGSPVPGPRTHRTVPTPGPT
ncbi:hypothetical protein GCM10010294_27980 [Streptomyces griseoloalbus]|uniref:hypothetical protein n=1 Tax=Streptomyces griseoloalbus TaxID=67303 RepID=UPI001876E74F|nr:hypothetical protein GCM10010294_27980 [Streptomyces griseoloalbus]